PEDATQSIEEVTRRITDLEDGRAELITRTEWSNQNNFVSQTIREIEENVDVSRNMIVDIENYDIIKNGSEVLQMSNLDSQKVWLNDVSEIGANLIPFADILIQSNREKWSYWNADSRAVTIDGFMRVRSRNSVDTIGKESSKFKLESRKQYTLSWRGY